MIWKILGVLVGYIVIVFFIFTTFSGFYFAIGADMAYQPGSYNVSMLWIVVSTILGLIAAIIGGYVCMRISGSKGAVKIFAGIVLLLGLTIGLFQALAPRPAEEVRTGDVPNAEAMQKSIQPIWVAFLNPLIGALGIIIGGGLVSKKEESE